MVIALQRQRAARRRSAAAVLELIVALGIVVGVLIPVAFSISQEQRLLRACYHQAVAMSIIDGELEVLRAGEWQSFKDGARTYAVHADSATNLPPGRFVLTRQDKLLRLEWLPEKKRQGGRVVREVKLP